MTQPTDPAQDISDIRSMMEKSSKILFLSGRAGIAVGIVALAGVLYAQDINNRVPPEDVQKFLIADALAVLVAAVALAIYYSGRMAKQRRLPVWNATAKHLVTEFAIPLAVGGVFCISLLVHQIYYLIPASMLTFYGLALVNASKYAVKEVRYLGLVQLAIGLLATFTPNEGLNLWALGFGIVHILFGLRIYFKYER
jgi:4-hydroxybenzoate polyprenyltransferase